MRTEQFRPILSFRPVRICSGRIKLKKSHFLAFAMDEKKDIYGREEINDKRLEIFIKSNSINKDVILEYLHDCELGKVIKHRAKKKMDAITRYKHLSHLDRISRIIKKPFVKLFQTDLEEFILDLERGKYKRSMDGKPLAQATIVSYKEIFRKFILWMNTNKGTKLDVSFIDTYRKDTEIPALSREEVELLMERCSNIRDRFIVKFLFDSGARIEEFLNIKWSDLTWDKEINCYMVRIRISKTKPRTISLQLSTKEINDYKKYIEEQGLFKIENFLIDMNYDAIRIMLTRLGKKILGKRVTPHVFRHTSATYYANKIPYFPFCYRYGWSFNSDQPQRYIDRNGIQEKDTAKIIKNDEIGKYKEESQKLKEDFNRLTSENKEIWKWLEKLVFANKLMLKATTKNKSGEENLKKQIKDMLSNEEEYTPTLTRK